jgi:amidase
MLAGPTWRDPWSVSAPLRGPAPITPVRACLVVDPAGLGRAEQVQKGVRKAARTLEQAGYLVDEVEPPSILTAAKTLLDMLNTPEIRAGYESFSALLPADTQQFVSAFYEVAGDPDPANTTASFVTRHSLLRAWGEFLETHPLIVAPIFSDIPLPGGDGPR